MRLVSSCVTLHSADEELNRVETISLTLDPVARRQRQFIVVNVNGIRSQDHVRRGQEPTPTSTRVSICVKACRAVEVKSHLDVAAGRIHKPNALDDCGSIDRGSLTGSGRNVEVINVSRSRRRNDVEQVAGSLHQKSRHRATVACGEGAYQ